jgi:hypothetical protein
MNRDFAVIEEADRVSEMVMKIEYLAHGSPECRLVLLHDFTEEEAGQLRAAVAELASRTASAIELHKLAWVRPIGDCRLTFHAWSRDCGVNREGGTTNFHCRLTAQTWDNVEGLIEPFESRATGYQWLFGVPGEVALLLSADGEW